MLWRHALPSRNMKRWSKLRAKAKKRTSLNALAEGKNEEALRLLRPVADRQDAEGKGEVELPAREMLADMLLEMGRPEQALAEYEKSLKTDPNRFNGLYGAAQAAASAHDSEKAKLYYSQLLKNCGNGERPELARAKTLLAKQ